MLKQKFPNGYTVVKPYLRITPQGEPFFGGTYFPPEQRYGRPGFAQVLLGLSETWKERRPELLTQVEQFLKGYSFGVIGHRS